jgi:uncharacterized protein (DUF2237 family)
MLTCPEYASHWCMAKNVQGGDLEACSLDPKTGFFRDGCCHTSKEDTGMHTVCSVMTEDFLVYGKSMGNDLITARPEFDFPGLKAGDRWCVCASRWLELYENGIPATIKAIQNELEEGATDKPQLVLPPSENEI